MLNKKTQLIVLNHQFIGHVKPVISLSFNPLASKLASGSVDNNIIVWNLQGEIKKAFRFKGHQVFFFESKIISLETRYCC
jgi:WD40 repeat protein